MKKHILKLDKRNKNVKLCQVCGELGLHRNFGYQKEIIHKGFIKDGVIFAEKSCLYGGCSTNG